MIIDCPDHFGQPMLAIQQTSFTSPCTLHLSHGVIEVEMDPISEFVRSMESTVVLSYMCSVDGCSFTIQPEELVQYAQHAKQLVKMFPEEVAAEEAKRAQEGEDDVAEEIVASQQGWPKCEQEPGEEWDDYTKRKSEYTRRMLAERHAAADAAMEKKDPIESLRRVFGG